MCRREGEVGREEEGDGQGELGKAEREMCVWVGGKNIAQNGGSLDMEEETVTGKVRDEKALVFFLYICVTWKTNRRKSR